MALRAAGEGYTRSTWIAYSGGEVSRIAMLGRNKVWRQMNKDHEEKHSSSYDSGSLRGRINESIKRMRDDGEETKRPSGKTLPMIPVTGGGKHKYFDNKSNDRF